MNIERRAVLALLAGFALRGGQRTSAEEAVEPRGGVLKTEAGPLAIFPEDNAWNLDISNLPVHPDSAVFVASMGSDKPLHPDFGTTWRGAPNGIPYVVVNDKQPRVPVTFRYADESDPGPYPIPLDAPIEGGSDSDGDRHVIVVDRDNRMLYELFRAFPGEAGWKADSGAVFDLDSNKLRPAGWTSADAAGLPIFSGLARYDEVVEQQELRHALRFTARRTQRGYIAPARHFASRSSDRKLPPLGLRLRLKADVDVTRFPPSAETILRGLKKYGMLLADNGSDWYISGAPDPRWNDDELRSLKRIKGNDFEAVMTGPITRR